MKIVSKVINSTVYTAVFALKTPAFDHSGISHLAEHMVFRGSDKYPASHELFFINTLLPASVNASTQNGMTFYFLECKHKALFLLLLDYLYSGLVQTEYLESEFELERDGVIFRELCMYERHEEYSLSAAALRGDTSSKNVNHYGGFSDTIGENSIDDLIRYKRTYYQQNKITLFLSGPEQITLPPELLAISASENEPANKSNDNITEPKVDDTKPLLKEQSNLVTSESKVTNGDKPHSVITWRFHAVYMQGCKAFRETLLITLNDSESVIIEDDINCSGLFAFRVITDRYQQLIPLIQDCFKHFEIKATTFDLVNTKHQNKEVKSCIQHYVEQQACLPLAAPFSYYLTSHHHSYLHAIEPRLAEETHLQAKQTRSSIAALASQYISLNHAPDLPRLFNKFMENQNVGKFSIFDKVNWVFDVSDIDNGALESLIISPKLWSPRLNGDCYAMGLGRKDGRFFVYGAEDVKASTREQMLMETLIH
ncbi:insulinase family protein [Glaciecola sp. MF2-115]|uniref:insulinase family protein n=1 Tax=Glaciecola sp. MF2-115 TaxID=3384827 RepID=UPI0039A328BB